MCTHGGPWQRHVPGARLQRPEFFDYNDMTRLTASIGFLGCVHEISQRIRGRVGVGGDTTACHVPGNILEDYGALPSFYVFVRSRPRTHTSMDHVH